MGGWFLSSLMRTLMPDIMKIKPSIKAGEVLMEIKTGDETMLSQCVAPQLPPTSLVRLRKILVPIDFSECSKQALACAVPFAEQFGAKLELLHVVAPYYGFDPNGFGGYQGSEASVNESAMKTLTALAQSTLPSKIECHVQARCGRVITEIVAAARELSADLIIISTHGYTGIKHVAFGSTAEGVVRHAPCPVLTVRAKENMNPE
jgi:universal stress protein A